MIVRKHPVCRRVRVDRWTIAGVATLLFAMAGPPARAFDTDSPYGVVAFIPDATRWNAIQSAGIGWARCPFSWRDIETSKGVYNWTLTDDVVNQANARGLHIYGGLGYTPTWASAGGHSYDPPTNSADWSSFVSVCVTRYKGSVHHWEMWNEPNLGQFWGGTQTQYINNILKIGADAAHAADPDCMVVAPEVSSCCSAQNWVTTALNSAPDKIDIICYHQYDGGDTVSGRLSAIDSMHTAIVNAGYGNKPLWITECGWTSDSIGEQAQANNLTGMLAGMPSRTWWKRFFWYQIWEGSSVLFGLLHQEETPKLDWYAQQSFATAHPAPPMATVNLSTTDIVNGINILTNADGHHTPATIASRSCRRNTNAGAGDFYLYFNVDDTFAYQGNHPSVTLTVDYYDGGTGSLTLEYDSNTGSGIPDIYRSGGSVALTGKNTWKQATFNINNAYFGNRQNAGADFRLSNGGNTFYLDVVQVDVLPAVDTTPPTFGPSISPSTTNSTTPTIAITAQDTGVGLDVASADFAYSWDGGSTFTTYVGRYVLHSKGTGSGSGNKYWYPDFYHPSYTIVSGDYLYYDIYTKNSAGTASGAVDLEGSMGNLRDSGITDQNGRNAHPGTDLSSVALNQWYHREFNLSSKAGLTITDFEMGHEIDNGTSEFYARNVLIVNKNTGAVQLRAANADAWTAVSDTVGPGNNGYTSTVGPEMLIGDPASPASCTGSNGTTSVQTVTAVFSSSLAPLLPGINNRIKFRISDLSTNRATSSAFSITVVSFTNRGFENGFSTAGGGYNGSVGTGWTPYVYTGAPSDLTFSDETGSGNFDTGAHSQKIQAGATKEGGVYNQINTVSGQTYTITVRVKSGSPAAWCFFGINTSGGTDSHESSGTIYPANNNRSTSWTTFTWTGQATGSKITLFLDTYDGVGYWDTATP